MGLYMGIFNFFHCIATNLSGKCFRFPDNQSISITNRCIRLVIGGVSMLIAGLLTLRVKEPEY